LFNSKEYRRIQRGKIKNLINKTSIQLSDKTHIIVWRRKTMQTYHPQRRAFTRQLETMSGDFAHKRPQVRMIGKHTSVSRQISATTICNHILSPQRNTQQQKSTKHKLETWRLLCRLSKFRRLSGTTNPSARRTETILAVQKL
jgi:hypothetical protein